MKKKMEGKDSLFYAFFFTVCTARARLSSIRLSVPTPGTARKRSHLGFNIHTGSEGNQSHIWSSSANVKTVNPHRFENDKRLRKTGPEARICRKSLKTGGWNRFRNPASGNRPQFAGFDQFPSNLFELESFRIKSIKIIVQLVRFPMFCHH